MKIPANPLLKSAVPGALAALSLCMSMHAVAQAPAVAPAVTAGAAPVQTYAANDVKRAFSFMDSNHDGQLSRAEAAGFKNVAKHFDAADTNKDGILSPDEFDDALNGRRVQ